jgi:hypothetical protein
MEHAHQSALENHVHRPPRLGRHRSLNLRIGISPDTKVVINDPDCAQYKLKKIFQDNWTAGSK